MQQPANLDAHTNNTGVASKVLHKHTYTQIHYATQKKIKDKWFVFFWVNKTKINNTDEMIRRRWT